MRCLALIALAGCGRIGFFGGAGAPGDGAPADACTFGPWGAAVQLVELESPQNDWSPALSPDSLTLIFQSNRPGGVGLGDLYQATRGAIGDRFTGPVLLGTLDSTFSDTAPTITGDGLTLYFTRDTGTGSRLWRSTRSSTALPFGAPVMVPEVAGVEIAGPTVSAAGDEMFYCDTNNTMISHATIGESGVVPDGPQSELNTMNPMGYPSLSGDGLTIYYEGGNGPNATLDLVMASRPARGAAFTLLGRVPGVNDPSSEDGDPEISKDGRTLVFESQRAGSAGLSDLWMATRSCQ